MIKEQTSNPSKNLIEHKDDRNYRAKKIPTQQLLEILEKSVRETHLFLSCDEFCFK